MATNIIEQPKDNKYYEKVFLSFLKRTNVVNNTEEWFKEHVKGISDLYDAKKILSIGGGTGGFDLMLYSLLHGVQHYIVVEPNEAMVATFRAKVQENKVFDFRSTRFEDYRHTMESVDFVVFAHVLSYIQDRKKALERGLKIGKKILIYHQSETGLHSILKKFGDNKTIDACTTSDISAILEELHCQYESWPVVHQLDVSDPDDDLIAFILEKEKVDQQTKALVVDYLKSSFPNGKMTLVDEVICAWV